MSKNIRSKRNRKQRAWLLGVIGVLVACFFISYYEIIIKVINDCSSSNGLFELIVL